MKQLSREEAIKLAKSGIWKKWSYEKQARFQLNQDKLCMDFSTFHKAVGKVLGRPVYTHEFSSSNHQNLIDELEGKIPKRTIKEIIELVPEEKRIIIIKDK